MSHRGYCYGNAAKESFCSGLKIIIRRHICRTREEGIST